MARRARLWYWYPASSDALPIVYNAAKDIVTVPPPGLLTPGTVSQLAQLLRQDDAALLQAMSTSPDVEAPDFCAIQRAVARFVLQSAASASSLNRAHCGCWR